jgi:hypothetical protein
MMNTTSGATHVFSNNPHLAGAHVVANSRNDWSRFLVEVGTGRFTGFVRFRNAFSNHCLSSDQAMDSRFAECDESDFDQVGSAMARWHYGADHVAFQYFSFEIPTPPRPMARTIKPSVDSGLCLQRRNGEFVGNNFANLLTM